MYMYLQLCNNIIKYKWGDRLVSPYTLNDLVSATTGNREIPLLIQVHPLEGYNMTFTWIPPEQNPNRVLNDIRRLLMKLWL